MRSKPVGVSHSVEIPGRRAELASVDIPGRRAELASGFDQALAAEEASALAQAEAEALAAIDASWLDEVQRTDVLKPGHVARGLASAQQDVNWDEDATCYYTRDAAGVPTPRAANANGGGHAAADWEEEQVTTHFSRLLAPEQPERPAIFELSSLLEPDEEPVPRSRLWSEPDPMRARVVARSGRQPPPPPPPRYATGRLPPAPRMPADVPAYTSYAPELQAGVEAGARTSLRPGRSPWLWSVAAALPICAALAAYALWAAPGRVWLNFAPAPSPNLALGEMVQLPKLTPASVEPAAVEPVPAAVASAEPAAALPEVAEPQPTAADIPSQQPVQVVAHDEPLVIDATRTMSAERASGRRNREQERSAVSPVLARRITPLVESAEPSSAAKSGSVDTPANLGTLQINSRPWSRILVDERFVGNTPQRALKLPVGRHTVKLVNEAFGMSKTLVVTIESGSTIKRVETLEEDVAPIASH